MIINRDMLEDFYEYVRKQMGIDVRVHDPPQEDEYARFMWGDRIVLVRPLSEGAEGEQIEVWCGDDDKRNDLEQAWVMHWTAMYQQMEGIVDDVPTPDTEAS